MVDLLMTNQNPQKVDLSHENTTQKNNHNDDKIVYTCSQCPETFSTLTAKKKHEKFYHYFSKPFMCECGQQFGKLCEVNYHIRRVHNKEKNYVCNVCKKGFFKNSDLVIHQNIHDQSAKFICEDCGRRFKHISNLIRHTRTHTGIKPYLCLPCNKRFSQVAALRQHETTEKHKELIAEKHKAANDSLTNINHQSPSISQIGKILNSSDDINKSKTDLKRKWWFYCKVCGERFPFSVLLRDHETKHLVNKDIRCNSCNEEFSYIKDINNHACVKNLDSHVKNNDFGDDDAGGDGDNVNDEHENVIIKDVINNSPAYQKEEKVLEEKYLLNECENIFNEDKKVELTLTQSGQIMLDNDEVLLTLNDKVYGLLLINNDVTILEKDNYLHILNSNKDQVIYDGTQDLTDVKGEFNVESENGVTQEDQEVRLVNSDNWVWTERCLTEEENPICEAINEDGNPDYNMNSRTECNETCHEKKNKTISSHLKRNIKEHKCPECKKNFTWNSSLRNHMQKKHAKRKEYSCTNCDKTYNSSLLLDHHVKRDHLKIRSYKCSVCNKGFFRRYDLKVHLRIHTDERPYICGVCGKRFRHLSHSIRHERTHLKDGVSKAA